MFWSTLFSLSLLASSGLAYPNPNTVTGDTGVHDPTLTRDASGKYWLFSTGVGIPIITSMDRVSWKFEGLVFPDGAKWTDPYTGTSNGNLWAPDVTYHNGTFYLYYAASSFGSQQSAIFFATSTTGAPGSYTNHGLVTATERGDSYNAIDPHLFIDNSTSFMTMGSFWSGIKLETISLTNEAHPSAPVIPLAERTTDGDAIEASFIYKHGSYYYLFASFDLCCKGTSSTYNIRVGRAKHPSGPYFDAEGVALLDGGGTLVLATHGNIYGPGGQSIYKDKDGTVMVYHYYTATDSQLGINMLDFSGGWPVVI